MSPLMAALHLPGLGCRDVCRCALQRRAAAFSLLVALSLLLRMGLMLDDVHRDSDSFTSSMELLLAPHRYIYLYMSETMIV